MNNWLKNFQKNWLCKDIDSIMNLFSENFIYFETPYDKITNKSILQKEWEYILNHNIQLLEFEEYIGVNNKHVIKFQYKYEVNGEQKSFKWIYLIELENNKCKYFYQVWE